MTMAERLGSDAKLATLADLAADRVEDLVPTLGLRVRRFGRLLAGCCPVHGGDNPTAFNLYPEGHTVRCNWKCRSHRCEKVFKQTVIGLVHGVLSHQKYGWGGNPNDRTIPFMEAVEWLCDFVGQKWRGLKADTALAEKKRFATRMAALSVTPGREATGWDPSVVRARLNCPSPYFLGRGFSGAVLDQFGVGDAKTQDVASPMFERAVVPILDRDGKMVVGTTGRSIHEQCHSCQRWHGHETCPTGDDKNLPSYAKWRHTPGFQKERHLFGYAQAREAIRRTGQVVLVESPGNVLRLHEAGITNAVGLFGVVLNDPQSVLLEASGASRVAVLMDPDEAGSEAAHEIRRMLCRTFRVAVPAWESETDIGEMPVEAVRSTFVPLLR